MPDELEELHEHAAHAHGDPRLAPVSVTMAVLAVLVAIATLLGHRAHTEEVVNQSKAADQWEYYQAKNIRQHEDELFADMASIITSSDAAAAAKARSKYADEAQKYKQDKSTIEEKARELEREVAAEEKRADRYDLAEVFLEVALVITSITMLSGRRGFWYTGIVLGAVGVGVVISGTIIR
jgi:Domain of unknown function (DUF4337)